NGEKRSTFVPGAKIFPKSKDAGSTPTIRFNCPSRLIVRPMICGSALNGGFHRLYLSIPPLGGPPALGSGKGRGSSSVKLRPIRGCTPSIEKKFCETVTFVS